MDCVNKIWDDGEYVCTAITSKKEIADDPCCDAVHVSQTPISVCDKICNKCKKIIPYDDDLYPVLAQNENLAEKLLTSEE